MQNQISFNKFNVVYEQEKWLDLNIDDDSSVSAPINNNACWLVPQYGSDDYVRRNTCILLKEFTPEVDVLAREKHNERIMDEVSIKLDTSVFSPSSGDYLGFENNLNNIVHSHYHKKSMDSGLTQYRVKYIVKKESYSLLVVIKFFETVSPETFNNINQVLKSIT